MNRHPRLRFVLVVTIAAVGAIVSAASVNFQSTYKSASAAGVSFFGKKVAALVIHKDESMRMSGMGQAGAVVEGSDGMLYEWVGGIDGLGNPVGFWKSLRRWARPLVSRALPFAQKIAPFIPGGAAVLTAATPILQQAGVAGYGGLGALYQAPDGTVYQMQGLSADDIRELFRVIDWLMPLFEDAK